MGFFQKFPYTDEHQLNLDWILRLFKTLHGGSTGQVLRKRSNKDFDWEWGAGGGGGTSDYDDLSNKPQINGVTLSGNKTLAQLGITDEIFWATYGTTTSAEVEAAYQAGKIVMVVYSNREYRLVQRTNSVNHRFTCLAQNVNYSLVLNSNTWSNTSSTFALSSAVHSIPSGGSSGQVLAKSSNTDYDVEWVTGGGGGLSPYTSNPAALGTASPGVSDNYSRGDHVHPKPSAADIGASPAVTEVTVNASGAVTQALDPGTIYHFTGVLTALTVTLVAPAPGILAQYHFDFDGGSSVPTVTIPNTVTMPDNQTYEANKHYEVDILNNYGLVSVWSS